MRKRIMGEKTLLEQAKELLCKSQRDICAAWRVIKEAELTLKKTAKN